MNSRKNIEATAGLPTTVYVWNSAGSPTCTELDQTRVHPTGGASEGTMAQDKSNESSCCCTHHFSPCSLWSTMCSWYLRTLERFFGWFGEKVAQYPLLVIPLSLVFVSVCSVGFVWFKVENRTEKLFIPQESKAINDLNAAEEYFRVKFRVEIILLVSTSDSPNVLSPKCLRQALKAHDAVVNLRSYSDVCVTMSGEKAVSPESCVMINPLEIFNFSESYIAKQDLKQIQEAVNSAYKDPRQSMRNGRPYRYNFNRMFGKVDRNPTNWSEITGAQALQMTYYVRDPSEEEDNKRVLEWEKRFVDKVPTLEEELSCFELYYSSERSLDDAIAESSGSDLTLVSITFTLMITFACVMLGKFLNPLTGHSLLANAGVFAVALGILAGFGMAMWCRVPFVSLVGVLPFLILGIGIDDMFILVDELDRQPRDLTVAQTVKQVMSRSGATVTMTTVTDLVAFAVSTSTSFPSIRYFCVYAALTVTFSYLMIVTYFVAIMSCDVRRIKSSRRDCLPFCHAPPTKSNGSYWDEPNLQTSNRIMMAWGKFLTLTGTKVFVVIFSLAFLAAGIYGATKIDESFDRRILAKDGSYLKKFLSAQTEYFELSIPVSIVVSGDVDYSKTTTQEKIRSLTTIVSSNRYYQDTVVSWIDAFTQHTKMANITITETNFMTNLKKFLQTPGFAFFDQDVKFSEDGETLEASRIIGLMKSSTDSTFQKNAMLSLREDLADLPNLDVYPITRTFIFFEQYAITSRETIRNLLIAGAAVLVVTSPFLLDCSVTILVVLNFVALVLELFGLMVLWDVSLNSVSMINLVMAIGFAVDYSAHIAHAYVMSDKQTANERVVDALSTLGASVFMGGFSTFLGMIVLAFAASEIFRIFFRMFLGIVLFGLLHGLCIMPVYLSMFCWRPAVTRPSTMRPRVSTESLPEINEPLDAELAESENEGKPKEDSDSELRSACSNEAFEMPDRKEKCNQETESNENAKVSDETYEEEREEGEEKREQREEKREESIVSNYEESERDADTEPPTPDGKKNDKEESTAPAHTSEDTPADHNKGDSSLPNPERETVL